MGGAHCDPNALSLSGMPGSALLRGNVQRVVHTETMIFFQKPVLLLGQNYL